MRLRILVSLTLVLLFSSFTNNKNKGLLILEDVFNRNIALHSIQLTMLMKERIGDEFINKKAEFKVAENPTRIYLKQEYPNKDLEVLYIAGANNNKALVNPNSFPWATLKLDPIGNTMRKGQHHSIFKSGFGFFVGVIEQLYSKYQNKAGGMVKYVGIVRYADIICHKIIIDNPYFAYMPYTVGANETLESISNKYKICDYMIIEHNPAVKSYDDLKPGMNIKIPNDYARHFTVYIDTANRVPVGVKIFDDKGLFEEYTYLNVKLNPKFCPTDFDRSNPNYGFH